MESISDKLRSLGVQLGLENNKPSVTTHLQKSLRTIELLINGETVVNLYGESISCDVDYLPSYQHGWITLSRKVSLELLCQVTRIELPQELRMDQILFLDTETSGLGGGTGTFAFMVGLGFFTETGFTVKQLFMRNPSEEASMLVELIRIASKFAAVLTYNGKSFDIPLLNNRYVLNGINSPFKEMAHIDLLQVTRKVWSNRFASRSLGNLENQLLGFFRSGEEVPGWMVPQIYFDYLINHDPNPLVGVFYHNKIDILSLAGLSILSCQLLNNPNAEHIHGLDKLGLAKVYQSLGRNSEALNIYDICIRTELPEEHQLQAVLNAAAVHKREKNWLSAITMWETAYQYQSLDACIELAKYYEHFSKEFALAIDWTEKAIALLEHDKSYYFKEMKQVELQRRLNRLQKKCEKLENINDTKSS
jgi:uncharacterized protein YprB with RNaseH-like and TPR domain